LFVPIVPISPGFWGNRLAGCLKAEQAFIGLPVFVAGKNNAFEAGWEVRNDVKEIAQCIHVTTYLQSIICKKGFLCKLTDAFFYICMN
jgi:hypothetical protein